MDSRRHLRPDILEGFRYSLRAALRRGRIDQELSDELAFHVDRETDRLIAAGMSPDEARGWRALTRRRRCTRIDEAADQRSAGGADDDDPVFGVCVGLHARRSVAVRSGRLRPCVRHVRDRWAVSTVRRAVLDHLVPGVRDAVAAPRLV
ncbi:MAG: permease prefix domain 1-containing protein [Gemmatimonadales bacterium]